jgi:predicted glycosyltransferase involved in capsule biosynthesis
VSGIGIPTTPNKYFGGVVSFSSSDYKRINGYPNTFWGWGGEDDEMQKRLERLGILSLNRPTRVP